MLMKENTELCRLSTTTHHGTMPKPLPARSMIRPPFFGFPIPPCSCGPLRAIGCVSSRELQWADPICRWLCMVSPVVIRVRSVFPSQVYRGPNNKGREQKKKAQHDWRDGHCGIVAGSPCAVAAPIRKVVCIYHPLGELLPIWVDGLCRNAVGGETKEIRPGRHP
jgi:hypothetical protein